MISRLDHNCLDICLDKTRDQDQDQGSNPQDQDQDQGSNPQDQDQDNENTVSRRDSVSKLPITAAVPSR